MKVYETLSTALCVHLCSFNMPRRALLFNYPHAGDTSKSYPFLHFTQISDQHLAILLVFWLRRLILFYHMGLLEDNIPDSGQCLYPLLSVFF